MPLQFEDLPEITSGAFGGKAEGLARLCRSGLAVPEGFAVSATTVGPNGWPEASRSEFRQRCRQLLDRGPIALRSSAPGEDSAERSFAGLFGSVLHVASEEEALAAAATCIASGASARVLAYARQAEPLPVGVVAQRLVDARTAGVAFSRDPEGRDPAVVVEAVQGFGDALVSGRVTPETWRVYRNGLGELEWRRSGPAEVLGVDRACEIAVVARATAERWGRALDLEWALDGAGVLWWLQARSITTGTSWRPPVVDRSSVGEDDGPISVWSNMNVRESMPDPVHPLTWSVWKATLVPVVMRGMTRIPESSPAFARASGIDLLDGRIYFNLNAFLGAPLAGSLSRLLPDPLDDRTSRLVRDLSSRGILRPRRNPGALFAMLRGIAAGLLSGSRPRPAGNDPAAWLAALARCAEDIKARPPTADLSDDSLLDEIMVLGRPEMAVLRESLGVASRSVMVWAIGTRIFHPWPEAARRLATGVTGNPTTAISVAIDRLVVAARPLAAAFDAGRNAAEILAGLRAAAPHDAAIRDWLAALDRFLDRFGHRAPREFDLATPRWADDPTMIVELVRAGLSRGEGESLSERLARLGDDREASIHKAIREAGPWRRPFMRWAARAVPAWMPMREAPKHTIMQAFLRSRHAALELGRRLHAAGALADPTDVFLLTFEELDGVVRRGTPVPSGLARRRRDLERWRGAEAPDVVRSDGVPVEEQAVPLEAGVLSGTGIGGGIGEGPVRILDEPDPRKVHQGDVLVVTFADPGWTPLFPRAGAVVMEVGGTMCHAAVVARELGVPAVFAVKDAKARLTDGARVRVDGDAGRVTLLGGERT